MIPQLLKRDASCSNVDSVQRGDRSSSRYLRSKMVKRLPAQCKARYEVNPGGMSNYSSPPLIEERDDIEEAVMIPQLLKRHGSNGDKRSVISLHVRFLCFVALAILQFCSVVFWVWGGSNYNSASKDALISPRFKEAPVSNNLDPNDIRSKADMAIEAIKRNHEAEMEVRRTTGFDNVTRELKEAISSLKEAKDQMEKLQAPTVIGEESKKQQQKDLEQVKQEVELSSNSFDETLPSFKKKATTKGIFVISLQGT